MHGREGVGFSESLTCTSQTRGRRGNEAETDPVRAFIA
jgi:hypothetical protein